MPAQAPLLVRTPPRISATATTAASATAAPRPSLGSGTRTAPHPEFRPQEIRPQSNPLVRQRIAADGRTVRWTATGGEGTPLLVLPGWTSHLTVDWTSGPVAAFHHALSERFRLLRYDPPGIGLSADSDAGTTSGRTSRTGPDAGPPDFSLEHQVDHAEAVIDAAGGAAVSVLATGFAGPVALALAARRPELVHKLVLFGTAASFLADPDHPDGLGPSVPKAIEGLVRADWRLGSRVVAELLLPGVAPEEVLWYSEYQRICATAGAAAAMLRANCALEARALLADVSAPLLALRKQDSYLVTASVVRRLVNAVADGRSRTLPGSSALPYFEGPAAVVSEVEAFLRPEHGRLTARELTVLARLREGLSNRAIARELGISEHTTARHLANVNVKLGVNSRGAAVARAVELSLL
ncbi:alpha/beta fold hydrolase [Streptomyces sp. LHD-70]|uniref:alpha/beta fold hydrolase n=1 Tax=Streptomyces sp. LHD-70 TaxID=3072140 RepID=UPI00280D654C|nr:alpha/beta fold hydrolase [Streptomyces sp. LHD-70]MDQ8705993.1 alpha/beta fold hydrolase [Streptomyces sp. LHD-70]